MSWRCLTIATACAILNMTPLKSRAAEPSSSPVTFEQAYLAALSRTESIEIQRSRQRQTEAQVDQAKGVLLPDIALNANYTRQDDTATTGSALNRGESSSSRLTLSQPLFSGGRDQAAYAAAKSTLAAQEANVSAARSLLLSAVAEAYFELQAAEQDLAHLKTSMKLTQDRVSELQRRVKIGRSRAGEVLTAQSQLAVLQSQVEQGEARVRIARDSFAYVTGLERDSTLTPIVDKPLKPRALSDYLKLVEERPDIMALRRSKDAQAAGVDIARGGHLPTLSLTGNYYLHRAPTATDGADWDVGLGLRIPIYEGGTVQAQVREAKEKETEAELRLRQQLRQAETQVRGAHNSLLSALDQVSSLEKAVTTAERAYREQVRDYQFGLVTNLEVLQALNTFQDTKRSLDRARVQASLSWADLDAAIAKVPTGGTK